MKPGKIVFFISLGLFFPMETRAAVEAEVLLNILLFIPVLLIISVLYAVWLHRRIKHHDRIIYQLRQLFEISSSALSSGYYYWDAVTGREAFSPKLNYTLSLNYRVTRFEELGPYMDKDDFRMLQVWVAKLKERKEQEGIAFTDVKCSLEIGGKRHYFLCTGRQLMDRTGLLAAAVVWFKDISESVYKEQRTKIDSQQMKAQLHRFAIVFNTIPFPIWLRDKDLHITYCNLAYQRLVECKSHQRAGPEALELHVQGKRLAQKALKMAKPAEELRHAILDGERHLYRMVEYPIAEEEILLGYAWDITDKEQVEKELARHITAQSDLLESSASAMAIYGADTRLKFFNQAFTLLWELDENWLETQPTYAQILDVLKEKRKLPEQLSYKNFKQNQLKFFTELLEPYNDFFYLPDGRVLRVIVIPHALGGLLFAYEDMTDRLVLERSYNMLIAVQKATLDNLYEGVAVLGEDGRIKLFNPIYARMWRHDPAMLQTAPHFSELLDRAKDLYRHEGNWEEIKQRILSIILERRVVTDRLERTDGKIIDRTCVPLPDGATLLSYLEVTDSILVERSLRERNQALEDVDRIKTEFLASISYELRSPLTSIIGFSEALDKQYFGILNDKQKEYVEGIYVSSQRLLSLINDILDLASIEAGYMRLKVDRFDIYAMLSAVIFLVKERMNEARISLVFECSPLIGYMLGDEKRLKQVMFKLLSNAIDYTNPGGTIMLNAHAVSGDRIVISIQDTAIGAPEGRQQLVFDKLYKQEKNDKPNTRNGAGVRFSVVRNFIELHKGEIDVEVIPGIGTRINCYFKREHPDLIEHQSEVIVAGNIESQDE